MIRNILLTLALVMPLTSFAQINNSKPTQSTAELPGLKVFGIGFETTKTKYEKELTKKGYKNPTQGADYIGSYDQYTVEFAGHKDCTFKIYYNVNTDSINIISITFPYTAYIQNHNARSSIVKQLDAKYGESKEENMNWGSRTEGHISNEWNYNGIRIASGYLWDSESDKVGDNKFELYYYTNAQRSTTVKPNEDL